MLCAIFLTQNLNNTHVVQTFSYIHERSMTVEKCWPGKKVSVNATNIGCELAGWVALSEQTFLQEKQPDFVILNMDNRVCKKKPTDAHTHSVCVSVSWNIGWIIIKKTSDMLNLKYIALSMNTNTTDNLTKMHNKPTEKSKTTSLHYST